MAKAKKAKTTKPATPPTPEPAPERKRTVRSTKKYTTQMIGDVEVKQPYWESTVNGVTKAFTSNTEAHAWYKENSPGGRKPKLFSAIKAFQKKLEGIELENPAHMGVDTEDNANSLRDIAAHATDIMVRFEEQGVS